MLHSGCNPNCLQRLICTTTSHYRSTCSGLSTSGGYETRTDNLLQDLKFSDEQIDALKGKDLVATCDAFDCGINSVYVQQARLGAKTLGPRLVDGIHRR